MQLNNLFRDSATLSSCSPRGPFHWGTSSKNVDEQKKHRGNYKGTRDHGKTRVPVNSMFPVYEGNLRGNEVTQVPA